LKTGELLQMKESLRLTLDRDDDGTGVLTARAQSGGFSGVGSAWFDLTAIAGLGHLLATSFPLLAARAYRLEGGYWEAAVLSERHLGLEFYPAGGSGAVGCRVQLSTGKSMTTPAARPVHCATLELRIEYEALRQFGLDLAALAQGSVDEVWLEGAA
jgi:hypothetical protein